MRSSLVLLTTLVVGSLAQVSYAPGSGPEQELPSQRRADSFGQQQQQQQPQQQQRQQQRQQQQQQQQQQFRQQFQPTDFSSDLPASSFRQPQQQDFQQAQRDFGHQGSQDFGASQSPLDSGAVPQHQQTLATQDRPQFRQRLGQFAAEPAEGRLGKLRNSPGGRFAGQQEAQFDQFVDPRDQFRGSPPQGRRPDQFGGGAPIQQQPQQQRASPKSQPDRSKSRFKSIAYDESDGEGAFADYSDEESAPEATPDRLSELLGKSTFKCKPSDTGYYADDTVDCNIFHYCTAGVKHSWVCPDGQSFHQINLICMPTGEGNICKRSGEFRFVNDFLYKQVNNDSVNPKYADRFHLDALATANFNGDPNSIDQFGGDLPPGRPQAGLQQGRNQQKQQRGQQFGQQGGQQFGQQEGQQFGQQGGQQLGRKRGQQLGQQLGRQRGQQPLPHEQQDNLPGFGGQHQQPLPHEQQDNLPGFGGQHQQPLPHEQQDNLPGFGGQRQQPLPHEQKTDLPGFGGRRPGGPGKQQAVAPGFGVPQPSGPGFAGPQGGPPGFDGPQGGRLNFGGPPRGRPGFNGPQGGRPGLNKPRGASGFDPRFGGPPPAGFNLPPQGAPSGPGQFPFGGQGFGTSSGGQQSLDQLRDRQHDVPQQQQGGRPGPLGGPLGRDKQDLDRPGSKSKVNRQEGRPGAQQPGQGGDRAQAQQRPRGRPNIQAGQGGFRPNLGPGGQNGVHPGFGGPGFAGRQGPSGQLAGRQGVPPSGFGPRGPQDSFGPGGPQGGPPRGFGGPSNDPSDAFFGSGRLVQPGQGKFGGLPPSGFGGPGGPTGFGGPQGGPPGDFGFDGPSGFSGQGPPRLRARSRGGPPAGFGGPSDGNANFLGRPPRASIPRTRSDDGERTANGVQYIDASQLRQSKEPSQRRPQRFQSPQGPRLEASQGRQDGQDRQSSRAEERSNFAGGQLGDPFPTTNLNPKLRFTADPPQF